MNAMLATAEHLSRRTREAAKYPFPSASIHRHGGSCAGGPESTVSNLGLKKSFYPANALELHLMLRFPGCGEHT